MGRIEKTVFISYRRTNLPWALAIYQNLTTNGFDVFFDYESINSGDFEQIILGNIRARAHFLVLLTPSALERCKEPGDWLRREIEVALDENRNVIPLFLEGFNFGDISVNRYLTGTLKFLKNYNGLEVPASYFDEAMKRLKTRYLNVPLDAVLHPITKKAQKVVRRQQDAANKAHTISAKEFAIRRTKIVIDGKIVNFELLGRGRPVIFLHTWIGSWKYWFPAMQAISKSFRAYALDMWGFGESAHDPKLYTIDQQTELLARFLDDLEIGKVALIGHGLGALVGFNFCTRWTKRVDRMMAVNCPIDYDFINERLYFSSIPDLKLWLIGKNPDATTALSDASKADPRAIQKSIDSFKSNGLFSKMRQTQVSCLLVHGQNDPAISALPADSSISLPHMMHYVMLDKSGHYPMIDEANCFNHLLMDFLLLDSGLSPQELQVK